MDKTMTIVDVNFLNDAVSVTNNEYEAEYTYNLLHEWLDLRKADMSFVLNEITNNESGKIPDNIYSIIDNEWILKPIKKIININSGAVQLKAADLMNAIDDLETNKNKKDFLKKHKILKDKIKKHRQSGLEKGGEYSVENLAFKILRNSGYLKRMMDIKNDYLTQELSLDEFLNPDM